MSWEKLLLRQTSMGEKRRYARRFPVERVHGRAGNRRVLRPVILLQVRLVLQSPAEPRSHDGVSRSLLSAPARFSCSPELRGMHEDVESRRERAWRDPARFPLLSPSPELTHWADLGGDTAAICAGFERNRTERAAESRNQQTVI